MGHTNAWGSKFDLGGKKVKCQHRIIILAILVDLLSPIICAKIRAQGLFVLEKKIFKGFSVIYLQFYTYASQDSLGLNKVSPTTKSLRPLKNFPL